ncbi:MAG: HAMP domain-containing sensor histidine kinase, partial [Clostridiales bacterium]
MRDIPGENNPENIDVIIKETGRLASLVNDILDISKLNSGVAILNLQLFDLSEDIASLVTNYNHLMAHDGYRIDFDYQQPAFVKGDQTQISQVVSNLLNNALTYTGADKKVNIVQIIHHGRVKISVSDSGAGIPEEQLSHIWQRYYQSPDNHLRATHGSGLGLSIVRTVMLRHQGTYGVESKLGQGSTFWFELPLAEK